MNYTVLKIINMESVRGSVYWLYPGITIFTFVAFTIISGNSW